MPMVNVSKIKMCQMYNNQEHGINASSITRSIIKYINLKKIKIKYKIKRIFIKIFFYKKR